jgi:hypothetical protein
MLCKPQVHLRRGRRRENFGFESVVEIRVIFRGEPLTNALDAAEALADEIFVAQTSVCDAGCVRRPTAREGALAGLLIQGNWRGMLVEPIGDRFDPRPPLGAAGFISNLAGRSPPLNGSRCYLPPHVFRRSLASSSSTRIECAPSDSMEQQNHFCTNQDGVSVPLPRLVMARS